jgi:hypothetical protein
MSSFRNDTYVFTDRYLEQNGGLDYPPKADCGICYGPGPCEHADTEELPE